MESRSIYIFIWGLNYFIFKKNNDVEINPLKFHQLILKIKLIAVILYWLYKRIKKILSVQKISQKKQLL